MLPPTNFSFGLTLFVNAEKIRPAFDSHSVADATRLSGALWAARAGLEGGLTSLIVRQVAAGSPDVVTLAIVAGRAAEGVRWMSEEGKSERTNCQCNNRHCSVVWVICNCVDLLQILSCSQGHFRFLSMDPEEIDMQYRFFHKAAQPLLELL